MVSRPLRYVAAVAAAMVGVAVVPMTDASAGAPTVAARSSLARKLDAARATACRTRRLSSCVVVTTTSTTVRPTTTTAPPPTTAPPTTARPTTTTVPPTTVAPTTVPPTTAPPTTAAPTTTATTVPAAPSPLFDESWGQGLRLASNRARGTWMPTDYTWQSQPAGAQYERGYEDFAGTSWNVNPNRDPAQSPFSIVDGNLRITARRIAPTYLNAVGGVVEQMLGQGQDGLNPPAWQGGILISDQSFRYGYIEARVTFDPAHAGKGMFPALWLYAARGDDPSGKSGAEIDIMESFGTTGAWSATTHYNTANGGVARPSRSADFGNTITGTHTWALDWQPTYLRFYFDGRLVWELTGADAAWFDAPMRLRMNYSMDAPWFGLDRHSDASTPSELWMDVDYVRVWATKP